MWWLKRVGVAVCLVSGVLAVGVVQPVLVGAAPVCQGPVTAPCVVVPGLVAEPVLTAFPGYPSIPVNFALAPDGKIFVADKSGRVLVYGGRGATTWSVVADLRGEVHDFWDRGVLGIAVDPQYASGSPYVYVLYTYDKDPMTGQGPPRWGSSAGGDGCPTPPGGGGAGVNSGDGCVVTARISRFPVDPATGSATGGEQVIFESNAARGWCEQYPSHSIGTLLFGPDGTLYAGAGDGASFDQPDWGQLGGQRAGTPVPANPCNDPSTTAGDGGRGGPMAAPGSQGGSLRAQSVRSTVATGYQPLDGTIIRINKDGSVPADNPLVGGSSGHGDRQPIVGYGLRNPFRFNFKPGTSELWIGDVGASTREEIDKATLGAGVVPNFGWPCYEGDLASYDFSVNRSFDLCTSINGAVPGSTVASPLVTPLLAYGHTGTTWDLNVDAGCKAVSTTDPGTAVVGGAFVTASDWPHGPSELNGAYIFGDYGRQCLWALTTTQQTSGGDPETLAHQLTPIASGLAPVSIQTGPDGAIYVLDIGDGAAGRAAGLWRIGTASSPIARFTATPPGGPPGVSGLSVRFDATTSVAAPGASIVDYAWDLDGNGTYTTNGATPSVSHTYTAVGPVTVGLRVRDSNGLTNTATHTLMIGSPPVINGLTTSVGSAGYLEGDIISYQVAATARSPLTYTVSGQYRHCDTPNGQGCHVHYNVLGTVPTDSQGRGSFTAPGHAGYSYLQLVVSATDATGLSTTATFDLRANWLTLTIDTFPPGLTVARDGNPATAPYRANQISSPSMTITTPAVQTVAGVTHLFTGWADTTTTGPTRTFTPAAGTIGLVAQFAAADGLTSIPPRRVLDTRVGTGAPVGPVPAQGIVHLDLRAAAVPATATAVLLNITATDATTPGYITVYPCSQPRPLASNLNTSTAQTVANLTQVAVDNNGQVCLYTQGSTQLVADLSGWFEKAGAMFTPSTPTRVLDTRIGTGAPIGKVPAQTSMTLDLSPRAPTGATSVVLNLTATEPEGTGFVTAYPCGQDRPLASNLNVIAGDVRPNQIVVALGPQATVCLYTHTATHLVADLLGWYGTNGVKMATQLPVRVLDTRDGTGGTTRLHAASTAVVDLSDRAPTAATGVVLNVTGVTPATDTYITVYPCSSDRPLASNLNLAPGDIRPNLVTVPLGTGNKICIYSQAPTDLIADIAAWSTNVA